MAALDSNSTADFPARLVVEQGPEPDQRFSLGNAPQTVGRSANNAIVINDPEISRRHAQITPQRAGYLIEDLGSTNGTFVNGRRLDQPAPLNHGDTVEFGDTVRLRFWAAGQPPIAPQAPVEDIPTPAFPPEPAEAYSVPAILPDPPPAAPAPDPAYFDEPSAPIPGNRNRILIGCGCLLLLACLICVGGVIALDSYDQGRLLYCGGLRPFWEIVLGPLGFNPVCP